MWQVRIGTLNTYTHVHTYTHTSAHTNTHTHMNTHPHTQTHAQARTHTHTHTDMHTYTHIHTHVRSANITEEAREEGGKRQGEVLPVCMCMCVSACVCVCLCAPRSTGSYILHKMLFQSLRQPESIYNCCQNLDRILYWEE